MKKHRRGTKPNEVLFRNNSTLNIAFYRFIVKLLIIFNIF